MELPILKFEPLNTRIMNHGDVLTLGGAGGLENGSMIVQPNSHLRFIFLYPSREVPDYLVKAREEAIMRRKKVKASAVVPRKTGRKGVRRTSTSPKKRGRAKRRKNRDPIIPDSGDDSEASWDMGKEDRHFKRGRLNDIPEEPFSLSKSSSSSEEESSSSEESGYEAPISSSEESEVQQEPVEAPSKNVRRSRRQRERGSSKKKKRKKRGKAKPKKKPEDIGRISELEEIMTKPQLFGGPSKGTLKIDGKFLRYQNTHGVIDLDLETVQHVIFHPNHGGDTSVLQFFLDEPLVINQGSRIKSHETRYYRMWTRRSNRRTIDRLFREFAHSLYDVREKYTFSIDLKPKRHLQFEGAPKKDMLKLQPTEHCMVTRSVYQPFFLVMLDAVSVVYFERAKVAPSFDLAFVLQVDGDCEVQMLFQIPVKYLVPLMGFFQRRNITWYSGPTNLDWAEICDEVESDPVGFEKEGGWEFLKWVGKEENYDYSDEEPTPKKPTETHATAVDGAVDVAIELESSSDGGSYKDSGAEDSDMDVDEAIPTAAAEEASDSVLNADVLSTEDIIEGKIVRSQKAKASAALENVSRKPKAKAALSESEDLSFAYSGASDENGLDGWISTATAPNNQKQ